jgi:hypothetical protein
MTLFQGKIPDGITERQLGEFIDSLDQIQRERRDGNI